MIRRLLVALALVASVVAATPVVASAATGPPAAVARPAAATTAAYPPISNTWRNVSGRQGSLNCLIEARQPFSHMVYIRKTAGVCSNLRFQVFVYNSQYIVQSAIKTGYISNGYTMQATAPGGQAICYVYISWHDGAGVYRDALYMRGGGVS